MKSAKSLLAVGIITAGLLISYGYVSIKNDVTSIMGSSKTTKKVEKKNEFKVEVVDVKTKEVNGTAASAKPTYSNTTVNFDSTLVQAGDSVVYTVTIKNSGNTKVSLKDVNVSPREDGSEAIFYVADSPAEELEPGAETTMEVTAAYDATYVGNVTSTTKEATATILYAQAN